MDQVKSELLVHWFMSQEFGLLRQICLRGWEKGNQASFLLRPVKVFWGAFCPEIMTSTLTAYLTRYPPLVHQGKSTKYPRLTPCQLSSFTELRCYCSCLKDLATASLLEYVAIHSHPTDYLVPLRTGQSCGLDMCHHWETTSRFVDSTFLLNSFTPRPPGGVKVPAPAHKRLQPLPEEPDSCLPFC